MKSSKGVYKNRLYWNITISASWYRTLRSLLDQGNSNWLGNQTKDYKGNSGQFCNSKVLLKLDKSDLFTQFLFERDILKVQQL